MCQREMRRRFGHLQEFPNAKLVSASSPYTPSRNGRRCITAGSSLWLGAGRQERGKTWRSPGPSVGRIARLPLLGGGFQKSPSLLRLGERRGAPSARSRQVLGNELSYHLRVGRAEPRGLSMLIKLVYPLPRRSPDHALANASFMPLGGVPVHRGHPVRVAV